MDCAGKFIIECRVFQIFRTTIYSDFQIVYLFNVIIYYDFNHIIDNGLFYRGLVSDRKVENQCQSTQGE
jgi:hypothetical protein